MQVVVTTFEPGTRKPFARMADIRKQVIIADGARIAAPCPHENECPCYCVATQALLHPKAGSLGQDEKLLYSVSCELVYRFPSEIGP